MTPLFTPHRVTTEGTATTAEVTVPDGDPRFRGAWFHAAQPAHTHRFSPSTTFGGLGFTNKSPNDNGDVPNNTAESEHDNATTTVAPDGYTAIRVNLPPIGFNKARVSIQIESTIELDLIDLEVPAVVVIDPGHGGVLPDSDAAKRDAGYIYNGNRGEWTLDGSATNHAISYGTPTFQIDQKLRQKTEEKALTLQLGLLLKTDLKRRFLAEHIVGNVTMTRSDDRNVGFGDRTQHSWAKGADIFLSLHFNGNISSAPRGSEVFVEPDEIRSNGCSNANYAQDADLSTRILTSMTRAIPGGGRRPADGVPRPKGFDPPESRSIPSDVYTDRDDRLRNTNTDPKSRACLAEVEFITNMQVEEALVSGPASSANRRTLSSAMARAAIRDIMIQIP